MNYALLDTVRREKPLVHHITNWVTIYDCAAVVKAFGASPVMAHAQEEVEDMVKLASAVVLNIGTLTAEVVDAMVLAARAANRKGIPVVLDACGAGATPYRDRACARLLAEARIDILKGNVSEVGRLAGVEAATRGVDAGAVAGDPATIARQLAARRNCTVVITGRTDIVASATRCVRVSNGCDAMGVVVGTGCMAASVIGTFAAVCKDTVEAAVVGLCCYEVAAELAAPGNPGPMAFKHAMIDRCVSLTVAEVTSRARIAEE